MVHYDLAWNPTRHEQREGRVDRFGQKAGEVRATMLYGQDNPVDGFILNVILRKAEAIRKELGVLVPMPEDEQRIGQALIKAALLKRNRRQEPMQFEFARPRCAVRPPQPSAGGAAGRYPAGRCLDAREPACCPGSGYGDRRCRHRHYAVPAPHPPPAHRHATGKRAVIDGGRDCYPRSARSDAAGMVVRCTSRRMLDSKPSANLSREAVVREIATALEFLTQHRGVLDHLAQERAEALLADHRRVREAARDVGQYDVRPCLPVDVLGVYVLLPDEL